MSVSSIRLSPAFRAQTTRAILAIVGFVLTYLAILLAAVALTVAGIVAGISIILYRPGTATILIGAGIASFGLLILIFLVKFAFSSQQVDRSHLTAVTAAEEPRLFAMIEAIVQQVGTQFPKQVYLSSSVNAAVFYDSSFWSMFFPVRKNLEIGMGLVNTVTDEELRAILAHEFGHFSQRTMTVGSYVYNANRVIYNMLHENDSYDRMVENWSSVSGFISLFVVIAVWIVRGIQWVLTKIYTVVNRSYLALSREMEFHADEVAAHVTGYPPLAHSLLRMGLAQQAYSTVIDYYNGKIAENVTSSNVFAEQSYTLTYMGREAGLEFADELPVVPLDEQGKFDKSKLVIEDQWVSHPSIEDRIARLRATGLDSSAAEPGPANALFTDARATQERLTRELFKGVTYAAPPRENELQAYRTEFNKRWAESHFPKCYHGYYDRHTPLFAAEELAELALLPAPAETMATLFSPERVELVTDTVSYVADTVTIRQIAAGQLDVKSFDYAGKRYRTNEARPLALQLERNQQEVTTALRENDRSAFRYFFHLERQSTATVELQQRYEALYRADALYDEYAANQQALLNSLQFIQTETSPAAVPGHFRHVRPYEEILKKELNGYLTDAILAGEVNTEVQNEIGQFCEDELIYFAGEQYRENALKLLYSNIQYAEHLRQRQYFLLKRDLLRYQEQLSVRN